MSADDDNSKESSPTENRGTLSDAQLDDILKDPRMKETILRKIGLAEDGERHYLIPSGMSTGRWPPCLPVTFWLGPFPPFPNAGGGASRRTCGGRGVDRRRGMDRRDGGQGHMLERRVHLLAHRET